LDQVKHAVQEAAVVPPLRSALKGDAKVLPNKTSCIVDAPSGR